jgi:Heterokaryon incompatibility protein (HET)
MRLLKVNDDGSFGFHSPFRPAVEYAVLSHTWGSDSEEVTFKDIVDGTGTEKRGYQKLQFCWNQACANGLNYFWVDTCCIDKSNSVELQEAINSMFRYYRDAARCFVYLSDVLAGDNTSRTENDGHFHASRWFTRGWTLQELIAPKIVEFYSQDLVRLGDKGSLERQIHEITGIANNALRGGPLEDFSIEERLGWAEKRQTTKEEDIVYCLLGIFNTFLPLIYGEGQKNALRRLKMAIKESEPRSFGEKVVFCRFLFINSLLKWTFRRSATWSSLAI